MTGEMVRIDPITGEEPDGTVWSTHAAIAQAVGGTVQPFDQYQGPYVLVGSDVRVGTRPYQVAVQHLGVVRLWLTDEGVYREDTDTMYHGIAYGDGDMGNILEAALNAMYGGKCDCWVCENPDEFLPS